VIIERDHPRDGATKQEAGIADNKEEKEMGGKERDTRGWKKHPRCGNSGID